MERRRKEGSEGGREDGRKEGKKEGRQAKIITGGKEEVMRCQGITGNPLSPLGQKNQLDQ